MKRNFQFIGLLCYATLVAGGIHAGQISRQPVTSKELTGTWRGEQNGAKVELVFKNRDDVIWRVDTQKTIKSGTARAEVQAAMKWVADKEAGYLSLYFRPAQREAQTRPVIEMGRAAYLTGGGGELRLTMLLTARKQSDDYYQLVKDFALVRVSSR